MPATPQLALHHGSWPLQGWSALCYDVSRGTFAQPALHAMDGVARRVQCTYNGPLETPNKVVTEAGDYLLLLQRCG